MDLLSMGISRMCRSWEKPIHKMNMDTHIGYICFHSKYNLIHNSHMYYFLNTAHILGHCMSHIVYH